MATVAELLQQGRTARGLSIAQVAETLKMRADHVTALEEGNYDAFVAPVYIRGFVRTYAALLKLEGPVVMSALDAELAQTEKFREPPSLTQQRPSALDKAMLLLSRINWRIALPVMGIVILALAGFLGVRLWQEHRARDPLQGIGPGLYRSPQKQSGAVLPLPPASPPKR